MNIDNAKKLVGQLKQLPDEKFYMPDWIIHKDCGTVACIAGWCSVLNGGPKNADRGMGIFWGQGENVAQFARHWLGLGIYEAKDLFGGEWAFRKEPTLDFCHITRTDAIAELNRMIAEEEGK